jgi:hypothetical protein
MEFVHGLPVRLSPPSHTTEMSSVSEPEPVLLDLPMCVPMIVLSDISCGQTTNGRFDKSHVDVSSSLIPTDVVLWGRSTDLPDLPAAAAGVAVAAAKDKTTSPNISTFMIRPITISPRPECLYSTFRSVPLNVNQFLHTTEMWTSDANT